MATITVTTEEGDSVELTVSPMDALQMFQNKYPNALKTNLSITEFINRWCEPSSEKATEDDELIEPEAPKHIPLKKGFK